MSVSNFHFLLLLFSLVSLLQSPAFAAKKSYIVYFGTHSHGRRPTSDDIDRAKNGHHEFLGSFLGSVDDAKDAISSSYGRYINGFAAVLDEDNVQELARHPEVVSIFPNELRQLQTTHSWEFLGLEEDNKVPPNSLWEKSRFGEDAIIGTIDTGVWPESKSFSDEGMGPVPQKWHGICESEDGDPKFKCNRKLIGSRNFNKGLLSLVHTVLNSTYVAPPEFFSGRDFQGHGAHTLATAGGNFVDKVSVFGNGYGTAKGGAPRARVASYKICWKDLNDPLYQGCSDEDVLAAFDAAIHDGVDVISGSIGLPVKVVGHREHFQDGFAIGSFHAMMHGILVVAAAGNEGPDPGFVSNVAPWLLTVGASTTDREFTSSVTLGDNKTIKGKSFAPKSPTSQNFHPLITADAAAAANTPPSHAQQCNPQSLDPEKVKGKILVCVNGTAGNFKAFYAAALGAVGLILVNYKEEKGKTLAEPFALPTSYVEFAAMESISQYIKSTKDPVATIGDAVTEFKTTPAPTMAHFSSRGPSVIDPATLKPDITAPGVNIISAFSEAIGPTLIFDDRRRIPFTAFYGTSMSCPHVAGIAGLIKTLHPDWSPSAIKSAIMTTATTRDHTGKNPILDYNGLEATPFQYGSGHVNPNDAMDPGLVYDMGIYDFLGYMCGRNYNQSMVNNFTRPETYSCPKLFNVADFNYPSISIPNLNGPITITRRVKNVGASGGSYRAKVKEIQGVSVTVAPDNLDFTIYGEEKTFQISFIPIGKEKPKEYVFGELIWSDGSHRVRSPIALKLV